MTHPRRLERAHWLADIVGLDHVAVDPNPHGVPFALRSSRLAWSLVGETATHHLVLQDDVVPVDDFWARIHEAVAVHPDKAMAFYANWNSKNGAFMRMAATVGAEWAQACEHEDAPSLAVLLPRAHALGFAEWAAKLADATEDDEALTRYLRSVQTPLYVSVPSLVEHEGDRSIVGNERHGSRRSACFSRRAKPITVGARVIRPNFSCPVIRNGFTRFLMPKRTVREYRKVPWKRLGVAYRQVDACFRQFADGRPDLIAQVAHEFGGEYVATLWTTAFLMGLQAQRYLGGPRQARNSIEWILQASLKTLAISGLRSADWGRASDRALDCCADLMQAALAVGALEVVAGGTVGHAPPPCLQGGSR
jgi:hypothetical protein